ncbi:MAG: prepilin-type N-terminal cleavage/methylation domain-containing protein [Planctomycetota bacterium]
MRERRADSDPAFTLIELLVVISIIALLIGILLPALGAARESARSAVCLANLAQMSVAFQGYANDSDDRLPPHSYADERLINPSGLPNAKVWWCVAEVEGTPEEVFQASFLGPYLGGVSDIGACPTWDPPDDYLFDLYAFPGFPQLPPIDYGYNGRMLGVPGPDGPARWIGFRLGQLRQPSETILVADHAIFQPSWGDGLVFSLEFELQPPIPDTYLPRAGSSPDSSIATIHGRHAGTANVAWADGHASSKRVRLEESDPEEELRVLGDLFDGDSPNNTWWDGGVPR